MEYWWALPSRVRLPPQQMHFATILAMREARIPLLTLDKNVFHGGAHVIAFPCLGWTLSWSKTNLYTAPGWSLQHSTEREENQKTIWPQRESNPQSFGSGIRRVTIAPWSQHVAPIFEVTQSSGFTEPNVTKVFSRHLTLVLQTRVISNDVSTSASAR